MFKSSNIMVWLSRRQEKKILDLCKAHMDKIVETVKWMRQTVHSFCDRNFDELEDNFKRTFDSEREADDIKRRILRDVSAGPLHPIDREEVIRLVLTADDIAENAKSGARRLRLASPEPFADEIKANLKEMADRCVEIVERVRIALDKLSESASAAIEVADQVEMLEESIDEFRLGLVKRVLKFGDEARSLGSWLMLLDAIENMEDVSDRSEDVADVIRSIAIMG